MKATTLRTLSEFTTYLEKVYDNVDFYLKDESKGIYVFSAHFKADRKRLIDKLDDIGNIQMPIELKEEFLEVLTISKHFIEFEFYIK